MDNITIFVAVMIVCVGLSSFSQILLKKSAMKTYTNKINAYLNPLVITGYGIFFICSLISVFCYKYVPLSSGTVIDSLGYVFVPIFSYIAFKEKLTAKQIIGICTIILGLLIFTVWG